MANFIIFDLDHGFMVGRFWYFESHSFVNTTQLVQLGAKHSLSHDISHELSHLVS